MVAFQGGAPAVQLPARSAATASGSELASHRWRPIPPCVPGVTGTATGGKRRECASVSSDLSLGPSSLGGRPSSLMWWPRIGRRSLAAPAHGRAVWGGVRGGHGTPGDARRSGGPTKNPPASAVRSTPDCRGQTKKGPTDGEPTDTPRSTTLVRDCDNRASVAMADQRPQGRGLCRGGGGGRRVVCAPVGVLRGQNAMPRTTCRDPGPPCGAPPSGRSPAARPVKGACLRSSDFVPP